MRTMAVLGGVTDRILSLPGWLVIALVFLLPALEASAFVGFVFPGEIVVLLGGVAAWRGTVPLWAVIVAAVSGAIIGDTVGYFIGRRWGRGMLRGTLGRLPLIRRHLDKHLDTAQAYVRRRKGSAVFFGRFTTALRVLVPGLAGMSDVHYPTFLAYNVAGGVLWGTGFALLGYIAGASYRHVASIASRLGLVLLGLVVIGLILGRLVRRLGIRSERVRDFLARVASSPPVEWTRRRFPSQVAWVGRRLTLSTPRGFPLMFALAVAALCAWAFGGLTQDVVAHDDTYTFDPHVLSWVVAHRSDALTSLMRAVTWLGSTAVLYPALIMVAALLWRRRRDWQSGALLAAALLGAVGLYQLVKLAVGRTRPPEVFWIGHYSGGAFPSGHATQTIAFYGMVAFLLSVRRSGRARVWLWIAAAIVTLVVGSSRIYLGAHWMTDVLGGYALGGCWLSLVIAFALWREWFWKANRSDPDAQMPSSPDELEKGGRSTDIASSGFLRSVRGHVGSIEIHRTSPRANGTTSLGGGSVPSCQAGPFAYTSRAAAPPTTPLRPGRFCVPANEGAGARTRRAEASVCRPGRGERPAAALPRLCAGAGRRGVDFVGTVDHDLTCSGGLTLPPSSGLPYGKIWAGPREARKLTGGDGMHVVFGATGGAGGALVQELSTGRLLARAVSRSRAVKLPEGVEGLSADAADAAQAREACQGATVVYHCAQPPYERWAEEFPTLTENIANAAAAAGATLVFADNLYAYGPVDRPMTEDLPTRATTKKGRVRALMAERLLSAHRAGTMQVVIGRSSDYYGPGGANSVVGDVLFGAAVKGRRPLAWPLGCAP